MLSGRVRIAFILIVLASWQLGVLAFGQVLDLAALLPDLDSSDFATRQAASQKLILATEITQDMWAQVLTQARTPEQRHRLLAAARHHMLVELRLKDFPPRGPGCLGMAQRVISPAERQHVGRPGVLVNATFPGFPAFAYLQAGDLITAINDVVIDTDTSNDRFMQLVQLNPAGQPVTLTLVRDGKEITHQITLASFEALTRMYERADPYPALGVRYEMQWRQVRDKLLGQSAAAKPTEIELLQ